MKLFDVSFSYNSIPTGITMEPERLCLTCNKPLKGRTDKKFCDDYCRNNYNNQLKSNTINLVRNINNAVTIYVMGVGI
jgi:predicted nucleic acid-binding Zn ribbon protein